VASPVLNAQDQAEEEAVRNLPKAFRDDSGAIRSANEARNTVSSQNQSVMFFHRFSWSGTFFADFIEPDHHTLMSS
jgi:hypothetical protein